GFTLIEMLVVVTVIGILVGMAAPKIDATEFRMRGAVREVGTTLLAAQGQAVMRQHDVVVAIDTVGRRLRVHSDADNDGVVDEGEAVRT
ncbi:MAG: prepilin-type N-terminal cleavage/methylation domain-containing protein, partial [Actinobacteria bacterium]|nr:prepilin-type N-terminal cleavage/methylation domain-containing protein [Actinomycetota bacterium]